MQSTQLLRWTRRYLEKQGFDVLYGDTDSLFVDLHLAEDIATRAALERGEDLCREINAALARFVGERYGVASRLELKFEKFYRRYFLPASRSGGEGRARRGRR